MEKHELLKVFKALSDETRLEIVQMLSLEKRCACQLQEKFDITQPTLSHHMKMLVDSQLLIQTKIGKWVYYQINPDVLNDILVFITDLSETKIIS
ncbi:MAG: transcriptional regulator [Tenericutes bacterium HGW-Tenericutes-6]|jgi:ArsR family transcriptional regulator|nr:MAG: transcriptional regulator [Tenericutes bacterium HGW-Tenericutes-6]